MSTGLLLFLLCLFILLSAFFSCAETGIMSINRYRLRHLARLKKHYAARRVKLLLERPDRLLGMLLIGNTCADIFSSAVATVLAVRWFGEEGVAIAMAVLTFIVVIFAAVAPKTLGAIFPEKVSFFCSWPLQWTLKLIYPAVWLTNTISNRLLQLVGVDISQREPDQLNLEELRTVVHEASGNLPTKHQNMLLSILDLNKVTVDDIMVPRNEILGINLTEDNEDIRYQVLHLQHTRIPVYEESIDNIKGILHVRDCLRLITNNSFDKQQIVALLEPVHFILEATPLSRQLVNFQRENQRVGIVVDEYGDILGLVTLEDILEEIVGEFTTDYADLSRDIHPQDDGSYIVDGSISIRKLNRIMSWKFPTHGPKTLSGLIIEKLEMIPRTGTCLLINRHPIEVMQVKDNIVKTARIAIKKR